MSEINEKGEIAKLTDMSVPELPQDGQVVADEDLLLNKYNLEILAMETWDKLNKLTLSSGPDFETVKVSLLAYINVLKKLNKNNFNSKQIF